MIAREPSARAPDLAALASPRKPCVWDMPHYRCYFFDEGHHIIAAQTRDCADDAGAVRWARSLFETHDKPPRCESFEVWCRARILDEQGPIG